MNQAPSVSGLQQGKAILRATPRLDGKVAIITGGAGGMGRSASLAFAAAGAKVAIWDIQNKAGAETEAASNRPVARSPSQPGFVRPKWRAPG